MERELLLDGVEPEPIMSRMRFPLAAAVLLSAAGAARAQDVIVLRSGQELQGEVISLNYKSVEYELAAAANVKQKEDAKNIVEIKPDRNRMTFEFSSGMTALETNDLDAAIDRFERVRKDTRASDLLRQMAAINVVKSHFMKDNLAGCIAACKGLRQERQDSYFLRESYDYEVRCHLAARNVAAAGQVLTEFENRGKAENIQEWAKSAEVMRAGLLELQGRHRDALPIYRKYGNDKDVSEEAILGELRCLREAGDWAGLSGRAGAVITSEKGKRGASARLLTGAFNARGEANLQSGKFKDALLDFMQGVAPLAKGGGGSREHETALARAAVSAARVARDEKEKAKKELYKQRAQELLEELRKGYGANSPHVAEVQKAISEVK
jgi:hypothetical protein